MRKFLLTVLLTLATTWLPGAEPQVAGELLVDLDPSGLAVGPLTNWPNAGQLKGSFKAPKDAPDIRELAGRKIVFFNGSAYLASDFLAPESITGDSDWSMEVWAFKHEIGQRESTLVSWAPRGQGAGNTAQFSWGANGLAAIHWARDLPWKSIPATGSWQHLVIVYAGGMESLYVNGRPDQQAPRGLQITGGHPVVIGAAMTLQGTESVFVGAMAAVRIHSGALTAQQVLANFEQERGHLPVVPPAPPSVAVNPPAGIRTHSAYLSALVLATGGAATQARVYWGMRDGGTDASGWEHSLALGNCAIGTLSRQVSGLSAGAVYFYRFQVANAAGEQWSPGVASFTTRRPPTGTAADQQPFRLVVWPDSQNATEAWPEVLGQMARWVADNRDAESIRYVIHVGDLVQTGADETQWQSFDKAWRSLDGRVPYILGTGNHDLDRLGPRSTTLFNKYFPVSRLKRQPGYGASLADDESNNSYHVFRAAGLNWLIVSLIFNPNDAALEWASRVVERHPGHVVIVSTHSYLTHTGRDQSGQRIWDRFVKRHRNILCVFCGHLSTVHYQGVGDSGNTVYEMLFDWQNSEKVDNNTYLALVEFDPFQRRIVVESYSPVLDRYLTDRQAGFVLENVTFPAPPPTEQPTK